MARAEPYGEMSQLTLTSAREHLQPKSPPRSGPDGHRERSADAS